MELNDNFRKDWIDFMSTKVDGVYNVPLYLPLDLKEFNHMKKMPPKINVVVSVIEKYTRSVKVQYNLFGNTFDEIIYLPTSKSLQTIIDDTNKKIYNKVNKWILENDETFILNQYKNSSKSLFSSIEKYQQEKLRKEREQKLNRITNG